MQARKKLAFKFEAKNLLELGLRGYQEKIRGTIKT